MPVTIVNKLIHEVVWDDGDARRRASAWDKQLTSLTNPAALLANAFQKAAGAISAFTIDAGKNFAQYENVLSHARRTMGLTREETLDLGDSLIALATNFEEGGLKAGVTANQLGRISGILGQLGFNAQYGQETFRNLVETVAKVGVAFGMTNEKAAEGLGILQNLYDLPTEQIENAASSIAYLGNTTVATAGQIMDIMTRMGGIAGILGVTAQEAAALAATLRESGVRAQVAGTAMSQIFSRLASDVDKFAEVLGKGGLDAGMLRMQIESGHATDALKSVLQAIQTINATEGKIAATQALADLGLQGVRVQQTLLALSNNIAGLNTNIVKSNQAFQEGKAVNEAYEAAIDNTQQKMGQFTNLLDAIQKIIGKDLALAFSDFLDQHLIPFTKHFQEWLETSKGADAIFGRDGLIAQGLDWIGQKLTELEPGFYELLDNLDTLIPEAARKVNASINEWLENFQVDISDTQDGIQRFISAINSIDEAIQLVKETWNILVDTVQGSLQTLENIGKPLQAIIYPIARMHEEAKRVKEVYSDMPNEIYKSNEAIDEFVNGIHSATEAGEEMGDVYYGHSILPNIEKGMIQIIDKTLEYNNTLAQTMGRADEFGQSIATVAGHTKYLYQTSENTWSNINREIQRGTDRWHLAYNRQLKDAKDVEFQLYQTADAVANLGIAYTGMAQEAGKTLRDLAVVTHDIWKDATTIPDTTSAIVAQATAQNQAAGPINLSGVSGNILSATGLMQQARAARSQTPVTTPTANVTNINISTVAVDETSKNRLVRDITRTQSQQARNSFWG